MTVSMVFDAFGTLFDVEAVQLRAESIWPGRGRALSDLWRTKQLQYSWLQTLMGIHDDFDTVTAVALEYAVRALGLEPLAAAKQLLDDYAVLPVFPDVPPVLESLSQHRLAILSNGSRATLDRLVRHGRLDGTFEAVISADECAAFKPDPRVYALAPARLAVAARDILFVSSNSWDAAGAAAFGFQSVWVNRSGGEPDRLGSPYKEVASLSSVPSLLA